MAFSPEPGHGFDGFSVLNTLADHRFHCTRSSPRISEVPLSDEKQLPQQHISEVRVEGETVTLWSPSLEIRLPARWARKLLPWYQGPGRTILCNADTSRFNLVGGTKIVDQLVLSYVDETGQLAAERVAGNLIEVLDGLLPHPSPGPEESR